MITYLSRLTNERDSLTAAATSLAETAAHEDRDLTDTERSSLTGWQERCGQIDAQLVEYNAQAESARAYARLRTELDRPDPELEPRPGELLESRAGDSWGDAFIESPAFQNYEGHGSSGRVELPFDFESRAAISLATLPPGVPPPYFYTGAMYQLVSPLLDAIGKVTVGVNSVEWLSWGGAPPEALVVAEGELKPEAAITPTAKTDSLDTYAHWKGITRQALEDIPQIRSIIENKLRGGLVRALEAAVLAALTAAAADIPDATHDDSLLAAIRVGIATVQAAGYAQRNVVMLNPADYANLDLAVMGVTVGGPQRQSSVWGITTVPVPSLPEGTAYVGDMSTAVTMFNRGTASVYLTDSHADYFVRNILLILAEVRALMAVTDPQAVCMVTGPVVTPQEARMAATVDALKVYLGLDPASTVDAEAMAAAVDAANDYVGVLRPDLVVDPDAWPPRATQAALVEAARLYGRRGSVQGIAAFADVGVSMLPRIDPEVRSLLELGEYQPSVIA